MRRTAGPSGRASREPGQGLTAAAISVVVRAIGRLAVLRVTFLDVNEIHYELSQERRDSNGPTYGS